jgi:hypothetical protein
MIMNIYREKQKPDSLWALLVVAVTMVMNVIVFFFYDYEDISFLYKTVAMALLTAAFLSLVRLDTEISKDAVKFRLFPLHFRWVVIPMKDIKNLSVVTFRPIREYGGWGFRRVKNGKAYIIRGRDGLRLEFPDGRHVLIGTQNKETLQKLFSK